MRMLLCREAQAITGARSLLLKLVDPSQTPRVPGEVRREARALLRFYPPSHQLKPLVLTAIELLRQQGEEWPEEELTG